MPTKTTKPPSTSKRAVTPVQRGTWEATLRNVRAANARMRRLHTQQERDLAALRIRIEQLNGRVASLEQSLGPDAGPDADEATQ